MSEVKSYSSAAIEAFRRFTKKYDFYAIAFKFGDVRDPKPHVEYKLFTGEGLWNLFKDPAAAPLFRETKGTIRYNVRDMMRGKMRAVDRSKLLGAAVHTVRFEGVFEEVFPSKSGDRSRAQEAAIAERLTGEAWKGETWKAVGHEKMTARTSTPDVISPSGVTIEVKGDNSDLRLSYEALAERLAQ